MPDPILRNLGKTIGYRILMIPIIFLFCFLVAAVVFVAYVAIEMVAGDSGDGSLVIC